MTSLEEENLDFLLKKPWLWWKYIDLIFMNEKFMDELDKFHPTIKFTCDCSREKAHVLDLQAILENNKISTDLCVKKTDSHQYLYASSCHPYHCVKSIPSSQALLQLHRICSNNTFYGNRCNQLEKWLSDRN